MNIDNLLGDLQDQLKNLDKVSERLQSAEHTVRSKNRLVSATVDAGGQLTDLQLHSTGYKKLAPAELTSLIMTTIQDARRLADTGAREAFGDLVPAESFLANLSPGTMPKMDEIFGEIERVFAPGAVGTVMKGASTSAAEPAESRDDDDGWTGERTARDRRAGP